MAGKRKKIKKPAVRVITKEINLEPVEVIQTKNVYKVSLSLINGDRLDAGDIIKHVRVLKVLSVTKKENRSADVECEIIKRHWEETRI